MSWSSNLGISTYEELPGLEQTSTHLGSFGSMDDSNHSPGTTLPGQEAKRKESSAKHRRCSVSMDLWQYGWSDYMGTLNIYHLVMTNVAMGNGPFIRGLYANPRNFSMVCACPIFCQIPEMGTYPGEGHLTLNPANIHLKDLVPFSMVRAHLRWSLVLR